MTIEDYCGTVNASEFIHRCMEEQGRELNSAVEESYEHLRSCKPCRTSVANKLHEHIITNREFDSALFFERLSDLESAYR